MCKNDKMEQQMTACIEKAVINTAKNQQSGPQYLFLPFELQLSVNFLP